MVVVSGTLLLQSFVSISFDDKIKKEFQSSFPEADSVHWRETDNGSDVQFISNSIHYHIWYAPDGTATKVYRYAQVDFLSPYLKLALKKKFPTLSLYGMEEICTDEDIRYQLVLEDNSNWYQIHGDAYGHFEVDKHYKKSK